MKMWYINVLMYANVYQCISMYINVYQCIFMYINVYRRISMYTNVYLLSCSFWVPDGVSNEDGEAATAAVVWKGTTVSWFVACWGHTCSLFSPQNRSSMPACHLSLTLCLLSLYFKPERAHFFCLWEASK